MSIHPSNEILVSVIIPSLNEAKLISQHLSQYTPEIKQKYRMETVVSDGGSSDGTIEIAKSLADIVVVSDPNEKQNIAIGRNTGVKHAQGRYFYIINADTLIDDVDKFFDLTLRELNRKKVAALTCAVRVFPEDQKLSDKMFHFCYNNYVRVLNKIGIGMGRGECHIIKEETFLKLGGYNEEMAAGEDFDLYRRAAKLGKIKFIKGVAIYESPRRYRKYGYIRVFWDWTKNSLSVFFKHKAISKEWEQVR